MHFIPEAARRAASRRSALQRSHARACGRCRRPMSNGARSALADHKALDGAGKRAAFALYYGPLHFLLIQHIVRELAHRSSPGHRRRSRLRHRRRRRGDRRVDDAAAARARRRHASVDARRSAIHLQGVRPPRRRAPRARRDDAVPERHVDRRRGVRRQRTEASRIAPSCWHRDRKQDQRSSTS